MPRVALPIALQPVGYSLRPFNLSVFIMERILQEDASGCGIACIAMLADRPYQKVRQLAVDHLGYHKTSKEFYTGTRELKQLGKLLNLKIGYRCIPFRDYSKVPGLAILAVNFSENTGLWHWVVFRRDQDGPYVLDPLRRVKKTRRTDFGRMKVGWWAAGR